MYVSLFSRQSNNEKKLEAVRTGVRAISVSGKMDIIQMHSHICFSDEISSPLGLSWFPWLPLLVFPCLSPDICFLNHVFFLFLLLLGRPTPFHLSASVLHLPSSLDNFCLLSLPLNSHLKSLPFTLFSLSHTPV